MRRNMVPWVGSLFSRTPETGGLIPRFEQEMKELVERFFSEDGGWLTGAEALSPTADVVETDGQFEITLDLPGLKPDQVHVELRNGALWISGKTEEEKETKDKTFHRVERRHGEFRRILPLPAAVNEEKAAARMENGVLKVTLPKTEQAKPKPITVKA